MGLVLLVLRFVAVPILGLVISVGFLLMVLENNLSGMLLNADFYSRTIAGQDTYNRIYDKVLLDQEMEKITQGLLGDIQVVSHEDIVGLLKEILPPEYLQSQVDGAIRSSVDYLNEDAEALEIYLELGPPLDRIKPALFAYIDRRIDEIPEEEVGQTEFTPDQVPELAGRYVDRFRTLAGGQVPASIPSLKALPRPIRIVLFDLVFDRAVKDISLGERVKAGLQESRGEIRKEFVEGETHGVLKQAVRPLATPLMDDAVDRLRENLDSEDRLDLIGRIASLNGELTEEEIRDRMGQGRRWLNQGRGLATTWALPMVVGGAALMILVHWPNLASGLRRTGITLALIGGAYFVIGKFLGSRVLDWVTTFVERSTSQVPGVPDSLVVLVSDLLVSFGRQFAEGSTDLSLNLLKVGAVLFGASFAMLILRPLLPGLRVVGVAILYGAGRGVGALRRVRSGAHSDALESQPAVIEEGTPSEIADDGTPPEIRDVEIPPEQREPDST